jgi:hypothetical protein
VVCIELSTVWARALFCFCDRAAGRVAGTVDGHLGLFMRVKEGETRKLLMYTVPCSAEVSICDGRESLSVSLLKDG